MTETRSAADQRTRRRFARRQWARRWGAWRWGLAGALTAIVALIVLAYALA